MKKIILNQEFNLFGRLDGKIFCDSLMIADTFSRRHDNVLRDINDLINDVAGDFSLLNFEESDYKIRGKIYTKYLMTKDGFTLLAMGFTGKKAMQFKIDYINRFNQMESFIKTLHEVRIDFPALTEAITYCHTTPKSHHYSNEINMINKIVLGMSAKKFKHSKGLDDNITSIRPYLSQKEINDLLDLQRIDIGLIYSGKEYEERKQILKNYYDKKNALIAS